MNYEEFFKSKISDLKARNLYRDPKKPQKDLLNFCSNDYLNLSDNKTVKNAVIKAIQQFGFGAKASRYVFESSGLVFELEKKLSKLKKTAETIVFGSGYLSGSGIIPALILENDFIVADKLIHSCLIEGCKLSNAKLMRFAHNDLNHAKEILEKIRQQNESAKILIITETVFSMDGDLGKVNELITLAKQYNAMILSDDAHGIGIIQQNYQKYDLHLQCGTLSKAIGGYGGYVCGSQILIDYLRNFAKSAIYSTALPPAIIAGNLKALEIIVKNKKSGTKALENANYFCQLIGLENPESTIVPVIIGDAKKTIKLSEKLKDKGFLISAIRPPTVEANKSRLRITFCTNHKKSDIKKLAELILEFSK